MSMMALALVVLGLSDGQQNHQFVRPSPNQATVTFGRFADNERRAAFENWRREVHDRERATQQANLQRQRLALADTLDRLITAGDCDAAKDRARQSGWQDIAGEVNRVCENRDAS